MFDREHIENLIISELAGTISQEESLELNQSIERHPELAVLRQQLREKYARPEIGSSLNNLQSEVTFAKVKELSAKRRRRRLLKVSSAAAALLVIAVGYFWLQPTADSDLQVAVTKPSEAYVTLQLSSGEEVDLSGSGKKKIGNVLLNANNGRLTYSNESDGNLATATLHVPDGKDYTVQLSDGTEIVLNSGSTLTFPFSFPANKREITISGEAYLKVAKNPAIPFLVHVLQPAPNKGRDEALVRVLGTEFNVNSYNAGQIRVSLVEGSVLMKTINDSIRLKPGLEAVSNKELRLSAAPFDSKEVVGWKDGILEFKDATLATVLAEIPRWYGANVIIDDPGISGKAFTGAMNRNKPLTSFLEDLKFTHDINYYTRNGVIHLKESR